MNWADVVLIVFFSLTELRIVCTFAGKLFRNNPLDFVDTAKSCRLCKRIFPSVHELKEHVESFNHHFNLDCDDLFPLEYVLQQLLNKSGNLEKFSNSFICVDCRQHLVCHIW